MELILWVFSLKPNIFEKLFRAVNTESRGISFPEPTWDAAPVQRGLRRPIDGT
jgi:hypothetical protein